jgi:predicted DNA binding CopG/RHH family protein
MMNEKYKLSKEEKELLESFEGLGFTRDAASMVTSEKQIAREAADKFTKKSERINIRLTSYDLDHIKRIAIKEGMPYQTLISSILHKYAAGYLKTG